MRRWLLVTKESDYSSEDSDWRDLDKKDEIHYIIDQRINPGDKVLIYRSGQWTSISHIFQVKNTKILEKGKYKICLYKKISIPSYLKLSELKDKGIIKKKRKFRRRIYKIPLDKWSEIIGFIMENNPDLLSPPKPITFLRYEKQGYPSNLKKLFLEHLKLVKNFDLESFNEEAAKYRIILPLLEFMGWDIHDSKKVYPEDFVSERYVDYIINDYESNKVCLEAKKPCVELDGCPETQLKWYCASKNIALGILTNGVLWRFYKFHFYDNQLGAIKEQELEEINLLKDDKDIIFNKFLEYFWNNKTSNRKSKLKQREPEDILKIAEKIDDLNESEVKQVIIIPLLESLGWDIINEKEFIFSPKAEVKIRKNNRKLKKRISVDFVLKGKQKIAFEVKKTGTKDLEIHASHVKAFCEKKDYDLGIATDGKRWDFIFLKNGKYHDEKTLDLPKSDEKVLKYLNNYLKIN